LWADMPREEQLESIRRTRTVSRVFQSYNLPVIPNLNWSTEQSFEFCFQGVPVGCPVAFTECRTPSGCEEDKQAFLCGLHEAVRQVRPQTLVIYGGQPHEWWIRRDLPQASTQIVFLESWTDARGRIRKAQEQEARNRNQPELFPIGGKQWADVEAVAA
jgi:hypothetical protein